MNSVHGDAIVIRGARQNNLKRVNVGSDVSAVGGDRGGGLGQVFAGVRRALRRGLPPLRRDLQPVRAPVPRPHRQPAGRAVDGMLPSMAIDHTTPVRTSRSTVGTMTSITDYLRALYARAAKLHCRGCGQPVARATPSIGVRDPAQPSGGGRRSSAFPSAWGT